MLAAGDFYSLAVRHTGTTRAQSVVVEGGDGGIVEVSGTLDASNDAGEGGSVHVLGLDPGRGITGGNNRAIWVNAEGRRFVTERGIDRYVFDVVMQQQPEGHWAIFDEDDRDGFRMGGPHFISADGVDTEKVQRLGVDNPAVTQKADTIEALAELIGVPSEALAETVRHYNQLVANGESTDVDGLPPEDPPPRFTIDTPPYYATKLYPMANKSAGGVSIDLQTHALDGDGRPVPGLYAAGDCYIQLKKPKKAAKLFEELVERFPKSELAKTAQTRLKNLRSMQP